MALTLDLTSNNFSRTNALYLANAADLAYSDDPGAAATSVLGLNAQTFVHTPSDTQGFVGSAQDFVVLAFRGSESAISHPEDWINDLHANLGTFNPPYSGEVHGGFAGALAGAWNDVDGLLRKVLGAMQAVGAAGTGKPVFVTGHSLGGALATLASCRLASGNLPASTGIAAMPLSLQPTYTFGCPRVGNTAFCQAYTPPTFRVINDLDIVPRLPFKATEAQRIRAALPPFAPKWLKDLLAAANGATDYSDLGQPIYLDANGHQTVGGNGPDWFNTYVNEALKSLFRSLNAPVTDHFMDSYIYALSH